MDARAAATLAVMPRSAARLALFLAIATGAAGHADARQAATPPAGGYDAIDAYTTALRPLKAAILGGNESVQHAAMSALRQLHDPALEPLLATLRGSDRWTLRVDSVLGLAEISPDRRINLALVEQLPGERDREAAVGAVIGLDLADAAQLRAMLDWVDLSPPQRALIAARIRKKGGIADGAALVRLAGSKSPEVAGLATAVLLDQKSPDAAALEAKCREQLASLAPNMRSAAAAVVAEACAANSLKGASPFVAALGALPALNDDGRMRILGSLLLLDAERAYPLLARGIAAESSPGRRLPYAALLVASGVRAPAAEWNRLKGENELLEAIAGIGLALSEGSDTAAYARVLALENRVLLRAAHDGARHLGEGHERALGRECLAFVLKPGPTPPALSESLLVVLCRHAELAPEEFRAPLADDALDQPTRDALIIALLNAGTREAAAVAGSAKEKASRLGRGNIAVLEARHAAELGREDLDELMRLAGGASNAPAPVRIQAAWLWARHSGKAAEAIRELTAASGTDAGSDAGTSAGSTTGAGR